MASGAWPQVRGARGFRVPWTLPTQQFVTRYRTLGVVTVEEMLGKVTGLQVLPGPPRCSPLLLGEPGPGGSFRVSAPKVGWITLGSSGPCGPARRGPLQSPLPPSPVAVVCVRECACGGGGCRGHQCCAVHAQSLWGQGLTSTHEARRRPDAPRGSGPSSQHHREEDPWQLQRPEVPSGESRASACSPARPDSGSWSDLLPPRPRGTVLSFHVPASVGEAQGGAPLSLFRANDHRLGV